MATSAIILAAGQGTRLRPFTNDLPKCLVKFGGRSLLDHQLTALRTAGVNDIIIVTGYREDMIRVAHPEVEVRYNENYASTNMVASMFCATDIMSTGDDLIVAYADVLFEPRVVRDLLDNSGEVGLAVNMRWRELWEARMHDPLADAETLEIDESGNIIDLGHRATDYSQIHGQYMGLIRFSANVAKRLPTIYAEMDREASYDGGSFENMYMTAFLRHLIAIGLNIQGVFIEGGWLEIDSVYDLKLYESLRKKGKLDIFCYLEGKVL